MIHTAVISTQKQMSKKIAKWRASQPSCITWKGGKLLGILTLIWLNFNPNANPVLVSAVRVAATWWHIHAHSITLKLPYISFYPCSTLIWLSLNCSRLRWQEISWPWPSGIWRHSVGCKMQREGGNSWGLGDGVLHARAFCIGLRPWGAWVLSCIHAQGFKDLQKKAPKTDFICSLLTKKW